MTVLHKDVPVGEQHIVYQWSFATTADRDAATYVVSDIGKIAAVGAAAPYDFYVLANNVGPVFYEVASGSPPGAIDVGNTLYVDAVHGDNGTAQPERLDLPYATIAAAIAAAGANDTIRLTPGVYAEEALTLPANVTLIGAGWQTTSVGVAGAAADIITMGNGSGVTGVTVIVPSAVNLAGIKHTAGTGSVTAINLQGDGAAGQGLGIYKTGTGKLIGGNIRVEQGGMDVCFRCDSGVLALDDCHVPQSVGTISSVAYATGAGREQFQALNVGNSNVASAIRIGGTATIKVYTPNIFNVTTALRISSDGCTFTSTGGQYGAVTTTVVVDGGLTGTGTTVQVLSTLLQPTFQFPPAAAANTSFIVQFQQEPTSLRESGQRIIGSDLSLGFSELGSGLTVGKGDPYSDGILVYTSDSTATSTTIGGNLTDVTSAAQSLDSSTFTWQGTAPNHCIYVGSNRRDALGVGLKHWGARVSQTIAGVGGSYVVEVWTGSVWQSIGVMAHSRAERYRYGNDLFLRANSEEVLHWGLSENSVSWGQTTVDGNLLYWMRVRIATAVTTLPVFERWWFLESARVLNKSGQLYANGLSKWVTALVTAGNVFASGGTASAGSAVVGSGPSWTMAFDGSKLNQNNDSISTVFPIAPRVCTAHPVFIRVSYIFEQYNAAPTLEARFIGIEREGVLVADPAGTKVPIARTEAATTTLTAVPGVVTNVTPTATSTTKVLSFTTGPYDISDLYAGDQIHYQVFLQNDGGGGGSATDVTVIAIELEGVAYADGDVLQ